MLALKLQSAGNISMKFQCDINEFEKLAKSLNPLKILYGIRNKKTNKFLTIGFLDSQLIYGDSRNMLQAKLWEEKENAEYVLNFLKQDKNFNKNDYVVEQCNDKELEALYDLYRMDYE